jgi:hypothetical protein
VKLQELQDALAKAKVLTIKDGKVHIGDKDKAFPVRGLAPFDEGKGIDIAYSVAATFPDASSTIIEGKASFLFLGKDHNILKGPADNPIRSIDVRATFEFTRNQDVLDVTLCYKLDQWRFLSGFPQLPVPFDSESLRYDYESGNSVLDRFKFGSCYLYLTTYKHELQVDTLFGDASLKETVILQEGLNFVGRGASAGTLGLLAQLGKGAPPVLHGQVIPRPSGDLPTQQIDELPWDVLPPRPRIPGIYLEARLGSGLSLPVGSNTTLDFTKLRFGMYSPLSNYWILENASYVPVMAYLGDVKIGKLTLVTISARIYGGRDDELVLAGAFGPEITFGKFLEAIDFQAAKSFLPGSLGNAISKIKPKSASITLVSYRDKHGVTKYEVASTQFTIGTGDSPVTWSPFKEFKAPLDKLFSIGFTSLRIAVVKPFDSKQREFSATIRGEITFLGVEFYVTVEAPGFYFMAGQKKSVEVNLQKYLRNELKMDLPFEALKKIPIFDIRNCSLVVQPGLYYAFAMDIIPGTELKIAGTPLPDLHFAVSCSPEGEKNNLDWQFEARAKPDQGVPIVDLIVWLAEQVKIKLSPPQSVRNLIIVDSVAVSYDSRGKQFGFECWGKLTLNRTTLDCCFTVAHSLDEENPEAGTTFGGRILFGPEGEDPLSFSLYFSKNSASTCAVAAYNDPYGHELKIQALAASVLPEFAKYIPASLTMTLNSALLAYYSYSKDPAKKLATDSTTSRTESTTGSEAKAGAETVVLFGVDLGAKVELSDLPIVGRAMPKDQAIGFESLRIIVASAPLEQESVASLDEILADTGVKPLSDMSGKGDGKGGLQKFNITAELLFGSLSRTLSLPVDEDTFKEPPADSPVTEPTGAEHAGGGEGLAALQAEEATDATKWFEVDKSMGPVTVRRIGLGYENGRVGIKFDASLRLSVLTFNLEGLGLTYPLDKFTQPSEFLKHVKFTLDGMGLALGNGPIEIGGSLVRVLRKDPRELELEGTLLIRTAVFTFSAFGSYVKVLDGTHSVMAFAVLLLELGDPTGTGAFVVTGLAFGFGVNRKLTLPRIEEVHTFPLIRAAMEKQDFADLQRLPRELRPFVAPSPGNFWIAAGIKFNSFGMVDSFLLVSVAFSMGGDVEIGLLGLSRMTTPPMVQPDKSIACAELALRGVISIPEGLIKFEAQLTQNSFIFSQACRLTGGFAFCLWFSGPHKGDFVISLGGYHPAFKRPQHYPLVPRLGIQLQIGTELSITGEAYFALTPSCIMAGGKLCAVFKTNVAILGEIEAWFIAYANFLLCWQPFYYLADMGVSMGVAFRLFGCAIRMELSVALRLWGAPFGGRAVVTLWIISFPIEFGASAPAANPLSAAEFIAKCLPAAKALSAVVGAAAAAKSLPQVPAKPDVFSVRITEGLLRQQEVEVTNPGTKEVEKRTYRIVNAHQLSLTAQSVIPCTRFTELTPEPERMKGVKLKAKASLGIRPMGKQVLDSEFSVTISPVKHKIASDEEKLEFRNKFSVSVVTGNVPDALWGKCAVENDVSLPKTPEAKTIEVAVGIRISCIVPKPQHELLDIQIWKLAYQNLPKKDVKWQNPEEEAARGYGADDAIFSTIMASKVIEERKEICDCLKKQMDGYLQKKALDTHEEQPPFAWNEVDHLEELASRKKGDSYFQSTIKLCPVGCSYER